MRMECSPKDWLRIAYIKMDNALESLHSEGITYNEKKEMEDYFEESGDEIGRKIWEAASLLRNGSLNGIDLKDWAMNNDDRFDGEDLSFKA